MQVIGRNQAGQLVGCFERQSGTVIGQRFEAGGRVVARAVFDGFRESMNWLYEIGASRVEIVG